MNVYIRGWLCLAFILFFMGCIGPSHNSGQLIADQISRRVAPMAAKLVSQFQQLPAEANVSRYANRVRSESWTEVRPDESGSPQQHLVSGEIWNDAIQAALEENGRVFLPAKNSPYYLDAPIILQSGQHFKADSEAEIRLKPHVNTCMLRNERIVGFREGPVPIEVVPDSGILVEGGIWTTRYFGRGMDNGNVLGRSDDKGSVKGCHGVILLQNIRGVVVRNLLVRESRPFGIHIGGSEFLVEKIRFHDHGRDGVHVGGASSFGIIRDIAGTMRDDPIALNAWDWQQYSVVWGPIHHMLVEEIRGAPVETGSYNSIRILPGVKQFPDGRTLPCDVHHVVIRDVTDILDFKLYNQPNLESGRDRDSSAGIGYVSNIFFEKIVLNSPGSFQIHVDVDSLSIRDVQLHFPVGPDYPLVEIGPKSQTYKHGGSADPANWVEIFSPDLNCTVRGLDVSGIRGNESQPHIPMEQLVRVIEMKPNPDYPSTTPRGGTGKGIWIR
jgi:hypothetical protein